MVLVAVSLYIALFIAIARHSAKREGYYSTIAVFGIAAFVYNIAIPAELALTTREWFLVSGKTILMPSWMQLLVVLQGCIALVAFYAGLSITQFSVSESVDLDVRSARPLLKRPRVAFLIMAILAAGLLAVAFAAKLGAVATYEGSYLVRYENPAFWLLTDYATLALAIVAAMSMISVKSEWLKATCCIAPIIAWSLYSSIKSPLLMGLLAAGAFLFGKRAKSPLSFPAILVAAAAFLLLIPLFSSYRSGADVQTSLDDYEFSFGSIEPAGPAMTLVDAISDPQGVRFGSTYLLAIPLLVPRAIWPDRPLDLAEEYARRTIDDWSPGRGQGYSLLAESYVNFGHFCPLLQYLLLGWLWGVGASAIKRILLPLGSRYWIAAYGTFGLFVLAMMHRSSSVYLVKTVFQYSPILIIYPYIIRHFVDTKSTGSTEPIQPRAPTGDSPPDVSDGQGSTESAQRS